jgi:hypothetical protein
MLPFLYQFFIIRQIASRHQGTKLTSLHPLSISLYYIILYIYIHTKIEDIDLTQWVHTNVRRIKKHTNFYLILKNKIEVLEYLSEWPDRQHGNGPRTHYSLLLAASDGGFFKLNCLKSRNDINIEINRAQ